MGNELDIRSELFSNVSKSLSGLLQEKADALPSDFNQTRFLQNCITVLEDVKDIEKCTAKSIYRTMAKGAFLGLDFFAKECYAIIYNKNVGTKDRPQYVKELQFQTDYKGERKLAYTYGVKKIKDIYAKLVREGDDFSVSVVEGKQSVNFIPIPFSDALVKGCFAVVYYEDGSMDYEVMSTAEIKKTRKDWSKAPDSTAWVLSEGEMYKKTVLRRLLKSVDLAFKNQEQAKAFNDGADFDEKKANEIVDIKLEDPLKKLNTKTEEIEFKELPEEAEVVEEVKCSACTTKITEAEKKYSFDKYGAALCRKCQSFQGA